MQDLECVTRCYADFYFKITHGADLALKIWHHQSAGFS